MSNVGVVVRSILKELGTPDFLHSFFSTISFHLEPKGWGSAYPELMNELYEGNLEVENSEKVREDLASIRQAFKKLSTKEIIYDIATPTETPDWIDHKVPEVTDISEFFITPSGANIFDVFDWALERMLEKKKPMILEMVGTGDRWLEYLRIT